MSCRYEIYCLNKLTHSPSRFGIFNPSVVRVFDKLWGTPATMLQLNA